MCSTFSAVFHHLCRADDEQRRRQAAHWPAVVSLSRSSGIRVKIPVKFMKSHSLFVLKLQLFRRGKPLASLEWAEASLSDKVRKSHDDFLSLPLRSHFDGLLCSAGAGQALLSYITICGLFCPAGALFLSALMWNTPNNRPLNISWGVRAEGRDLSKIY